MLAMPLTNIAIPAIAETFAYDGSLDKVALVLNK